jgi:hypothetical protein
LALFTSLDIDLFEAKYYFRVRVFALMMEEVSTSETPVNLYQTTRRNIPEDSHLQTRYRVNLKSHQIYYCKANCSIRYHSPYSQKTFFFEYIHHTEKYLQ